MSMLSERWQHVESQLATKDGVHTFYAGATALWDMKLDQFQRQLDTLLDGYGVPSSRGRRSRHDAVVPHEPDDDEHNEAVRRHLDWHEVG